MQTTDEFRYAKLWQPKTEEWHTDGRDEEAVMGPETAKRCAENDDCAVTVCCITYKHEDYIRDALDSFLMQKTTFKFKVFVGEDCGPDGTADIVREYAEKYPDIIVPFIREKNMGAQRNLIDLCNRATSPYIAFCEGDDYWVDEYKLQKQYDYMQQNPETRVCFSRVEISAPEDWFLRSWFKENKQGQLIFPDCEPLYKPQKNPFTAKDCVWVFPAQTATVFYRWNYDVEIPDWYYTGIIGDHPIFLMQLGEGDAHMLPDVTAIYRRSDVGVYMSQNMDEHFLKTRIDHIRWMTGMLSWYRTHIGDYPRVQFENRVKAETANYLRTALKYDDQEAVQRLFETYPAAAMLSLRAYLAFYDDSRVMTRTCGWKGYQLLVRHRVYRQILHPVVWFLKLVDFCKNGCKSIVRGVGKALRNMYDWLCYWIYSLVPKRKDLWVITSFRAKGYLDNAKYYYEYVVANHPEIELCWLTKDEEVYENLKEQNMLVLMMGSRKARKKMTHAAIAITDHNVMSDFAPRYGFNYRTKVVQLWHGVGFKSMGDGKVVKTVDERGVRYSTDILAKEGDCWCKKLCKRIKFFFVAPFRELFERYFIMVCPGQERVDMIGKVWNIPDEALFMAGHPRNVLLYQEQADPQNPKVMYAPTFRYDFVKETDLIENLITHLPHIQAMMERINGTFYIRLHPHTWRDYQNKFRYVLKAYDRIVLDTEKDIYTTLGTYSMVITDYSSISLDFAMLDRPTVYFCPDIVWFKEKQAGFNLDFEHSIPGPLVGTWEETLKHVQRYHEDPDADLAFRQEKCKYFFDRAVNGADNSARITAEIKRRLGLS